MTDATTAAPVVIVGASMGGLRAAEGLRRFGYTGPITVIGEETHLPYNRPPLSKGLLASDDGHEAVAFAHRPETADVDWVLGTRIESADLEARVVTSSTGRIFAYRALVIATGVRARRLQHETAEPAGCFALRTLDDAHGLRQALHPGARVAIVGSGFIACEVAAAAAELGCTVTVVGRTEFPMERALGRDLAAELLRRHESHGIEFRMNSEVARVLGDDRVSALELADGTVVPCDVVVEAIGSLPNTEWLAGNDIDTSRGVLTDSAMRALRWSGEPYPEVFAVGDVARFPHAIYDGEVHAVEHWNIPTETAKRAGKVLASLLNASPDATRVLDEEFAPVAAFWSDQGDVHLQAYGLLELADRTELLQGTLDSEFVLGYFRAERMVGVCGIGLKSVLMSYRQSLLLHADRAGSAR